MIAVAIGALPLALLDAHAVSYATREFLPTPIAGPSAAGMSPIEFAVHHWALTGVLGLLAACFMPAVATFAASLVTSSRDVLELATMIGGSPVRESAKRGSAAPGSTAMLGALPGFAATVVIVLVIVAAPWLYNAETALPALPVLAALGGVSVIAIAAVRAQAPRVMGTILRDVSALDRQRLATLEIRPPTAIERMVAGVIGEAGLAYRKDARLMRRRYPMAFALGALGFIVLVIIGLARPADPMPWLVAVLAGAGMYAVALTGRLFRPPIELPRLSATLPITAAARTRAKVAWIAAWSIVFVVIPLLFAVARLA
jgi:hypothetical protein